MAAAMVRDKFAICFGQNAYQHCDKLEKPQSDAQAMGAMLGALDFTTTIHTNTTQKQMKTAMKAFAQQLTPNCMAVFYFSGYSMQDQGINFCVPVDADVGLTSDIDDDCVSLNWVINCLMECEGCLACVFLEAARGNPFEESMAAVAKPTYKGLATMKPVAGCLIAFSAEPGSTVSFEYTLEPNAVFTTALLECLPQPDSVRRTMEKVRRQVSEATEGRQRVWSQSRMMDDFFFVRPFKEEVIATTTTTVRYISPTSSPQASPRRSPDRMASGSPRVYSPSSRRVHPWNFKYLSTPADWVMPQLSTGPQTATHPGKVDANVAVGIDPPIVSGTHTITLRFGRPPEETYAAHSIELIGADEGVYSHNSPGLTFELPSLRCCEAKFIIELDASNPGATMTMITNDGSPPESFPIKELANINVRPPYRLVHYMWDCGSYVQIVDDSH